MAAVIQTGLLIPFSAVVPTMNAGYLMDQICYEHIRLILVTSKEIVTSQVTNLFLHCCTCTSHGGISY